MLSRVAASLYWTARYMERAEYVARLVDVSLRMSAVQGGRSRGPEGDEWHSAIIASGGKEIFFSKYDTATRQNVPNFLLLDRDNPSSAASCLATARANARAVRTALTVDMWESINTTWMEISALDNCETSASEMYATLDWIKSRTIHFSGSYLTTMLRDQAYAFLRLGASLERADNTARILDVKYHILLPEHEAVGGGRDYYQWTSLLHAVAALRAYHAVYRDRVEPWNVAELLLIRRELPRSILGCLDQACQCIDDLAALHGGSACAPKGVHALRASLEAKSVEDIFEKGLHEALTELIVELSRVSKETAEFYLF
jgi:uncharacterized alpha-E superfamily protein